MCYRKGVPIFPRSFPESVELVTEQFDRVIIRPTFEKRYEVMQNDDEKNLVN